MQAGYGLKTPVKLDWTELKKNRDAFILRLNGLYQESAANAKVEVIKGHAAFVAPRVLECGGQKVTAPHILIASGSRPSMPKGVEGIEFAKTSDDFFLLEEQPEKVLIVGTGYIGVELGGIFTALGSHTTLTGRGDRILRAFDKEIALFVQENMIAAGLHFRTGCTPVALKPLEGGKTAVLFEKGGEPEVFDFVMFTTGRKAYTENLGLEKAGVKVNEKSGFVEADGMHQTSAEGVYALGDVTGEAMLTPVAVRAGRILSERLFNGQKELRMDYSNIPTVVFSHPPIGTIGLSEEEAVALHGQENIKVYRSRSVNTFYGPAPEKRQFTLMKLVCLVPEKERVIGLHAAGRNVDEMVQGFGVAIKMGATKADFDSVVAIHPTGSEEFVTMR